MTCVRPTVLALAALLVLAGCRTPAPPPANVVVLLVDTLRSDHLGCYGYERPTSPRIDELAAGGYVFDAAISQSSWTSPAVASLFTSVYPSAHGVVDFGSRLGEDFETLAQVLRRHGLRTAAVSANMAFINPDRGFDLGFDSFELAIHRALPEEADEKIFGMAPDDAAAVTDRAIRFLDAAGERPFFLYVHYLDPHSPYRPPAAWRERFTGGALAPGEEDPWFGAGGVVDAPVESLPALVGLYDAEIAYADAEIGRLLDVMRERGLLERSVVVVTSDHGEELRDHGAYGHGNTLFRELVQVPLVLHLPGAPEGPTRVADTVELVDIGPTVLEAVGIPDERRHDGRSLVPLLVSSGDGPLAGAWTRWIPGGSRSRPGQAGVREAGFSELAPKSRKDPFPPAHERSLRSARWHYLVAADGREELYDNAGDPAQHLDVAAQNASTVRDLAARVEDKVQRSRERAAGADPGPSRALSDEERERMRALGYVE